MISPEDSPGCQGLHYIFNYRDIHMVTLQYVQLLNMHPSPAAMLEGFVICWKIPFGTWGSCWVPTLIVGWGWHVGVPHRKIPGNWNTSPCWILDFLGHQTFLTTSWTVRKRLNQYYRPPVDWNPAVTWASLKLSQKGSAQARIFQAGSEELVKGQSPSPAPWWDVCAATGTSFTPHNRIRHTGTQRRGRAAGWGAGTDSQKGDPGLLWDFLHSRAGPTQEQLVL